MIDTFSDLSISSLATIDDVLEKDRQRYIRKGYGLLSASLITSTLIYCMPLVEQWVFISLQGLSVFKIYMIVILTSSHISYILANLYMWVIYTLKCPFFERYKISDVSYLTYQQPWPWDKDPVQWNIKKKQVLYNWIINATISTSLTVLSSLHSTQFRIDLESFPTHMEVILQLAICMVVEDTAFYWLHRMLHTPQLYRIIHKQHHEFYNSISVAAEYSHPLEFVLSNLFPTMLAPTLMGSSMHLATLSMWLILRVFETIDGHCGYEFSWSPYRLLPFSGSSEYHNFHHSHNVGNYSSFFYYWDTLCATNMDYFTHRAAKSRQIHLQKLKQQYLNKQKK